MTEVHEDNWTPDPQIKEVVDRRMAEVRQQIVDGFEAATPEQSQKDAEIYVGDQKVLGTVPMRMDFEIVTDEFDGLTDEQGRDKVMDLMLERFAIDLCDIFENGDTHLKTDPFLGALDGKKVVGRELKDVTLGSILLYKEAKPKKKTVEYTLYVRIGAVWA